MLADDTSPGKNSYKLVWDKNRTKEQVVSSSSNFLSGVMKTVADFSLFIVQIWHFTDPRLIKNSVFLRYFSLHAPRVGWAVNCRRGVEELAVLMGDMSGWSAASYLFVMTHPAQPRQFALSWVLPAGEQWCRRGACFSFCTFSMKIKSIYINYEARVFLSLWTIWWLFEHIYFLLVLPWEHFAWAVGK